MLSRMRNKKNIFTDERKTGDLQSISGVLSPFAKNVIGTKAFAEADVICNWKNIVGDETASYSKPLKIDFKKNERTQGTLVVETNGGAFALELQTKSKILIDKVNVFFGYQAVKFLRIIQNYDLDIGDDLGVTKSKKMLVTSEEENYINQVSEGMNSKNLSDVLKNLGRAIFSDNKKRDSDV